MTYSGTGIVDMLRCAKRHGLTKENSVLSVVKGKTDLDARWTIRKKAD